MHCAFRTVALLSICRVTTVAAPLTLDALDSGHYNPGGIHAINIQNHLTGVFAGTELRSFFAFDLSSVNGTITSATMRLFNPFVSQFQPGYSSPDPAETLNIYDVSTPAAEIIAGAGRAAGFADLGSGTLYGTRVMSAADNGTVVEIVLNNAALTGLNSSDGLFVLGGALGSLGTGDQFVFGHSMAAFVPDHTRQLVLDVASPEIPEPSTIGLAAAGLLLLITLRNRG
jgi:hypothetical protein